MSTLSMSLLSMPFDSEISGNGGTPLWAQGKAPSHLRAGQPCCWSLKFIHEGNHLCLLLPNKWLHWTSSNSFSWSKRGARNTPPKFCNMHPAVNLMPTASGVSTLHSGSPSISFWRCASRRSGCVLRFAEAILWPSICWRACWWVTAPAAAAILRRIFTICKTSQNCEALTNKTNVIQTKQQLSSASAVAQHLPRPGLMMPSSYGRMRRWLAWYGPACWRDGCLTRPWLLCLVLWRSALRKETNRLDSIRP